VYIRVSCAWYGCVSWGCDRKCHGCSDRLFSLKKRAKFNVRYNDKTIKYARAFGGVRYTKSDKRRRYAENNKQQGEITEKTRGKNGINTRMSGPVTQCSSADFSRRNGTSTPIIANTMGVGPTSSSLNASANWSGSMCTNPRVGKWGSEGDGMA
jgi:hypothetical protein